MTAFPKSIDETADLLKANGYVAGRDLATVVFLALKMGRPLFLEGEAGVGKTAIVEGLAQKIWRKAWGASLSACNAMRASISALPFTSGTMRRR